MKAKSSVLFLLTVCMVLGASCAQAVIPVKVITPDAMQGWSIEANAKGWGALCPWGPSTYENAAIADNQWSTSPFPYNGKGSFYATCDYFKSTAPTMQNDWTPSSVWLGTDQWKGQPVAGRNLGSITAMEYYSFVSKVPQRTAAKRSEAEYWTKNNWWNTWQQPIVITLTVESPDKTVRRQLWHRPWGYNYVGDDGMQEKGYWQKLNCLKPGSAGSSKWYSPAIGDYNVHPDMNEFGFTSWDLLMAGSLDSVFAGSTQTATFSNWTLVDTSNEPYPTGWKSPGWSDGTFPFNPTTGKPTPPTDPPGHPNCTATGKPINFWIGARCGQADLYLQGSYGLWANNTYGFRGQVDRFTLGFGRDVNNVPIAETYDFEPSATVPPVRVVGANIKSLGKQTPENYLNLAPIIQGAYLFNPVSGGPDYHTGSTEMAQKQFLCKVSGKVIRMNQGNWNNDFRLWTNSYFCIEDGSNLVYTETGVTPFAVLPAPVWVFLPPNRDVLRVYVGDYVSAYGYVEPLRWKNCGTPLIVWSQQDHVTEMKFL